VGRREYIFSYDICRITYLLIRFIYKFVQTLLGLTFGKKYKPYSLGWREYKIFMQWNTTWFSFHYHHWFSLLFLTECFTTLCVFLGFMAWSYNSFCEWAFFIFIEWTFTGNCYCMHSSYCFFILCFHVVKTLCFCYHIQRSLAETLACAASCIKDPEASVQ
jgi:hypothetical protein